MSSPRPRDEFIRTLYQVSLTQGNVWGKFVTAFDAYVLNEIEKAVSSTPDRALVAHGYAQALIGLREDVRHIQSRFEAVTNPTSRSSSQPAK